MLILHRATSLQLSTLLKQPKCCEIDGLILPEGEEIAPKFLLEFVVVRLSQDPKNFFWWLPRLIVVDRSVVGTCGFKYPPDSNGTVEIGYGVVSSQQGRGFATQAVNLLVMEGFSKHEIQTIKAFTTPSNLASERVLEKNQFTKYGNKADPEDGEVRVWRRTR